MNVPALISLMFLLPFHLWRGTALAELPPANEGGLMLVDEPGFNEVDVTLSVNVLSTFSASDVSTFTGGFYARLDIDPVTGRSAVFTLLGGEVEGTPVSTYLNIPFYGAVDISSTTLGGTMLTYSPPGVMDPVSGLGDASQHIFILTRGIISGFIFGRNYHYDYASTPVPGPGLGSEYFYDYSTAPNSGFGIGTQSVTIVPVGSTATRGVFDVTLILPVGFTDSITNAFGFDVTLNDSGIFKARGQISVPLSDYLAWTEQQGIPGADPTGLGGRGEICHALRWALGLGLVDDPLPHLLRPDPSRPRGFALLLPAHGSAGPLTIEASTSLVPGSWKSVGSPIPPGTSGSIVVAPSAHPARYLRIRADP